MKAGAAGDGCCGLATTDTATTALQRATHGKGRPEEAAVVKGRAGEKLVGDRAWKDEVDEACRISSP